MKNIPFEEEKIETFTCFDMERKREVTYFRKNFQIPLMECFFNAEVFKFSKDEFRWDVFEETKNGVEFNGNIYMNPSGTTLIHFMGLRFKTYKEAHDDCIKFLKRNYWIKFKWK